MALATQRDVRAMRDSIGNMFLNLGYGVVVDQRTDLHASIGAGANTQCSHSLNQFLSKRLVDAGLY